MIDYAFNVIDYTYKNIINNNYYCYFYFIKLLYLFKYNINKKLTN